MRNDGSVWYSHGKKDLSTSFSQEIFGIIKYFPVRSKIISFRGKYKRTFLWLGIVHTFCVKA